MVPFLHVTRDGHCEGFVGFYVGSLQNLHAVVNGSSRYTKLATKSTLL
jgi:hypothetical protein